MEIMKRLLLGMMVGGGAALLAGCPIYPDNSSYAQCETAYDCAAGYACTSRRAMRRCGGVLRRCVVQRRMRLLPGRNGMHPRGWFARMSAARQRRDGGRRSRRRLQHGHRRGRDGRGDRPGRHPGRSRVFRGRRRRRRVQLRRAVHGQRWAPSASTAFAQRAKPALLRRHPVSRCRSRCRRFLRRRRLPPPPCGGAAPACPRLDTGCDFNRGVCSVNPSACSSNAGCQGGAVCVEARCVAPCAPADAGSQCATGQVCVNGGCIPDQQARFTCQNDGNRGRSPTRATRAASASTATVTRLAMPTAAACAVPGESCKSVTIAKGTYAVCGTATDLGSECNPAVGLYCVSPKECIDGYCR